MKALYFLIAISAGVALAVQAVVNAKLRTHLGTPMQATLVSLIVSITTASLICLFARYPWPDRASLAEIPWPAWCGGFLGVLVLTAMVVAAPRIGLAATLALVVAGQMCTSLWLDHCGWLDLPTNPVNFWRLLGAGLVIGGATVLAVMR